MLVEIRIVTRPAELLILFRRRRRPLARPLFVLASLLLAPCCLLSCSLLPHCPYHRDQPLLAADHGEGSSGLEAAEEQAAVAGSSEGGEEATLAGSPAAQSIPGSSPCLPPERSALSRQVRRAAAWLAMLESRRARACNL